MNNTQSQQEERQALLQKILDSEAEKKIIVAGPGTGKTFTFQQILIRAESNKNLVMTFIRRLVNDMDEKLSDYADVKTFHEFAISRLYPIIGSRYKLVPFLTKLIKTDSKLLNLGLEDFDSKFQNLQEDCEELKFYLKRGDYCEAVSFDDSVYRLYQTLINGKLTLPIYELTLIDEFQDFNKLEVSVIKQLENNGKILIVGDDDQAVYDNRNSTPEHLRTLYNSEQYEIFELPFCSRCPKVVVDSVNYFIDKICDEGCLKDRISRRYIPYLEGMEVVNEKYPKRITTELSNFHTLAQFIASEIRKIDMDDIRESNDNSDKYPTVLIIGTRQCLNPINKKLKELFCHVDYRPSTEFDFTFYDAYRLLNANKESNLGWRIISELFLSDYKLKTIIEKSLNGEPIIHLLEEDFIKKIKYILELINSMHNNDADNNEILDELRDRLGDQFDTFIESFEEESLVNGKEANNIDEPTILLTSYQGCKGMSGGHVFIVGAVNGMMPKIDEEDGIDDIECSKFIVAMTRTKKCCYILSNRFGYNPRDGAFEPSTFINYIPSENLDDRGYLKASDIS